MHEPDGDSGGGGFAVGARDSDKFEVFLLDNEVNELVAFDGFDAKLLCREELGVRSWER